MYPKIHRIIKVAMTISNPTSTVAPAYVFIRCNPERNLAPIAILLLKMDEKQLIYYIRCILAILQYNGTWVPKLLQVGFFRERLKVIKRQQHQFAREQASL